jgi:hypothetical protein
MNLFFVHTPFQVLVAQNLIIKKKLSNNIILLSNTGANAKHFYDVFDKLLIKELWVEKYILGNLYNGVYSFKNPVKSYINLFKFSEKIKKLINKNSVEALYFGDINHPAYVFLAEYWQQKEINFFEEGLSHYNIPILKKKFDQSFIIKLKTFLTNYVVFRSLGVKNFSRYIQSTSDTRFGFEIKKKFNILPVEENKYDEIIKFDIYPSEGLKSLFKNEKFQKLRKDKRENVLYLSSSGSFLFSNPLEDGLTMILKIINKIQSNINFLIKFHPKDSDDKKVAILKYLKKEGISFIEILPELDLPVEFLFNQIKIDFIFGYGSSSQLYSEMLQPEVPNYNLFYTLNELYKDKNLENYFVEEAWRKWQKLFDRNYHKLPLEF